jgi:hypothetical protein
MIAVAVVVDYVLSLLKRILNLMLKLVVSNNRGIFFDNFNEKFPRLF